MPRFKIVYAPEAILEATRIAAYYNDISNGLGDRFRKNLFAEIKLIKKNPFTRSYRYDDVKFAVVKNFPYAAHYTIDETKLLVKIQGVFGFAQDSETNWKMRI